MPVTVDNACATGAPGERSDFAAAVAFAAAQATGANTNASASESRRMGRSRFTPGSVVI